MFRKIINTILLITIHCLLTTAVYGAAANYKVKYQGFLKSGNVPVNGPKGFIFRVRDGSGGAVQWESTCTDITVSTGIFRATFGETNVAAWDAIDWQNINAYLEIEIGDSGACGNSSSMTPQEKLLASPYSLLSSSSTALMKNSDGKLVVGSDSVMVSGTRMFFISSGTIALWSGSIATIPSGWALCDGTNSTPDLRDKFIVGAGTTSYAPGTTGGALTHTHTVPVHNHSVDVDAATSGGNSGTRNGDNGHGTTVAENGHTHSCNPPATTTSDTSLTTNTGSSLPPYYALAYIMKM